MAYGTMLLYVTSSSQSGGVKRISVNFRGGAYRSTGDNVTALKETGRSFVTGQVTFESLAAAITAIGTAPADATYGVVGNTGNGTLTLTNFKVTGFAQDIGDGMLEGGVQPVADCVCDYVATAASCV